VSPAVQPDPYKYFRLEAREILERLSQGILAMENSRPSPEGAAELLRYAHTLKGAARVVRQAEIAELAHRLEDTLAPLREPGAVLGAECAGEALEMLDRIQGHLASLQAETPLPAQPAAAPEPVIGAVRADLAEVDLLLTNIGEAGAEIGAMRSTLAGADGLRRAAQALADTLGSRNGGGGPRAQALAQEVQSQAVQWERRLATAIDRAEREVRAARDAAEQLRLAPAGALFAALERMARDVARQLGKRMEFQARGGELRLDAEVLAHAQKALVQAVRNAVAHGLEDEAGRRQAGKPPLGRVTVEVVRRGARVSFRCTDDGRGIDLDAVRRAAKSKGIAVGRGAEADQELLHLLLQGGLTTSGAVTENAGRGVGMDVIRSAVAALGGESSLHTEPGRGVTLEIVAPVSLAALPVLLVEAGGVPVGIPLDGVRGVVRVDSVSSLRIQGADVALHEGGGATVIPLTEIPGRPTSGPAATRSAVVLKSGVAMAVDRVLRTATIVRRPLPPLAITDPVVAGVAFDADGHPQIVLDPEEAAARARRQPAPQVVAASPPKSVLIVDDSLTTRMLEQSILESAGFRAEMAVSGEEGLLKAHQNPYDLFLVDVEMPGMDGFTFVERTLADPDLRGIPSILVTSRDAPEDRRRGMECGARHYVVKSEFDQDDLLAAIRRWTG
jgi:two-component system chemotaxis sensor kinase CheA